MSASTAAGSRFITGGHQGWLPEPSAPLESALWRQPEEFCFKRDFLSVLDILFFL